MKAVEEDEEDHDEDHPHPWTLNNSCRRRSRLYSILSDILARSREERYDPISCHQSIQKRFKKDKKYKYKKRRKAIQRLNLEKEEEEGF